MKKNNWSSAEGTSFHHVTVLTTPAKLIAIAEAYGSDYDDINDGEGKTNFDFVFKTDDGHTFTVYDWKEYRPLGLNELTEFHIGAKNEYISREAAWELENELMDY